MANSLHGKVKTYYLTPEELEAYRQKTKHPFNPDASKKVKRKVDYRWPQNRKG